MTKINELLANIRNRDIVIPEFQREYVWSREQAKQLIVSLFKDYPVGGLLLWRTDAPPELKNVDQLPEKIGTVQLLLDGQQRLTTLHMLLTGTIPIYYGAHEIFSDPRDLYFNLHSGISNKDVSQTYPSASGATRCCSRWGEFVIEQITNPLHGDQDDRLSPFLNRVPTAFRR